MKHAVPIGFLFGEYLFQPPVVREKLRILEHKAIKINNLSSVLKKFSDAVCSNGHPCWVMVANDEGHIFKRKTTMDFNSHIMAHFLQKFLV